MPTLRTLSKFQSKLQGGGARPNLFEVSIPKLPDAALNSTPGATWGSEEQEDFSIMCKAAQLPASTIASIDVPFRGRTLKVAGDRTIENWSITVINDENFNIRNAMEAWMNGIAKLSNNTGADKPSIHTCVMLMFINLEEVTRAIDSVQANSSTSDGGKSNSFESIQIY